MKAGRELDALIAEKVMGWAMRPMFKAQKTQAYDYKDRGDWVWVTHYEQEGYEHLIESYYPQIPEEEYESGFHPSTQIADAWLVVEKTSPRLWFLDNGRGMIEGEDKGYRFRVGIGKGSAVAIAPTVPLAICLAALKAIA